jgi:bifunctional N-acetylglucosamine-1-phosphate-uridyltransferase/glucosamine-1-phosphate-acetyltransferase GlmU-like protein
MKDRKLGAIILAAGKGKRMNSQKTNKVTLVLGKKPIILHSIELLEKIRCSLIVVVIGFAKKSVMDLVKSSSVVFAEQRVRLGTGHAVKKAMEKVPSDISDVLVIQGDDSFFLTESMIASLRHKHIATDSTVTLLTIEVKDPFGLGRIVRDSSGAIVAVVEEKDATAAQRDIKEINPACYIFRVDFLRKYLPKIPKSKVTGEYYLPALIKLAIHYDEKIETVNAGFIPWRGVNTKEELLEAEKLYSQMHN